MKIPQKFGVIAFALSAAAPFATAQPNDYELEKAQINYQTSAANPTVDPNAGGQLFFLSPLATTITPPGLSAITPGYVAGDLAYETSLEFPTLAAMNAAFPDGNYVVKGSSIGSVTLPLTGSLYPTTPAITGGAGTWLPGGVLALDPTVSNTLNLSLFTGYSTAGNAGAMYLRLLDLNGNQASALSELVATEAIFTGTRIVASPLTTFTIGTGEMTAGHMYVLILNYLTLTDVDKTTLAPYNIFDLYDMTTEVYITAQTETLATVAAPSITTQPTSQTATIGTAITFNVPGSFPSASALGWGTYWTFIDSHGNVGVPSKDTQNVTTTNAQLVINNVAASDAGTYYVTAICPGGFLESKSATLTVVAPSIPVVSTPPTSQTINNGSTLVLTAVAPGATSYQWTFNGNPVTDSTTGTTDVITGSGGPQLVITNTTGVSAGAYSVVATNSAGSSQPRPAATITVVNSSTPGSITSISSRAFVGTGDNVLIGGFYIVGSTSRSVLIQALGPALAPAPYNVSGTLQNPTLAIHQYQAGKDVILYTNTGWGSSQVLLNAAATVFAFPTLQANTPDSELLLTLPPGGYTAEVSGSDGGTGVALCGIYELP